jgi:hypothetical protein
MNDKQQQQWQLAAKMTMLLLCTYHSITTNTQQVYTVYTIQMLLNTRAEAGSSTALTMLTVTKKGQQLASCKAVPAPLLPALPALAA